MSAEPKATPRAFASYAQESIEHKDQVRALCEILVENGVAVILDQWDDDGRKDWSLWALEHLDHEFVLVVASQAYRERAEGTAHPEVGHGARFEAAILRDRLTANRPEWTRRILPVVLPGRSIADIPEFLTPHHTTRYEIGAISGEDEGLAYLLAHLHGVAQAVTPPLGTYRGPELPRVVAQDRDSLAPRTLNPVARTPLLEAALSRRAERARIGGKSQALALVGEGGIGKSVLLGQLLDRIEAEAGAAVLVSAASVTLGSSPDEQAVDQALGVAAHRTYGRTGLLALLRAVRDRHGPVTLLLDTLDLLVDQHTLAPLVDTIGEALAIGDVVFTCRTHEFDTYFGDVGISAPRLANRVTQFSLPPLDEAEIVAWARGHLADRDGERSDHEAFLLSLEGGVARTGSLRDVCALPVRLALTCQAFGELGRVPEDLTVTGLYNAYWDARVRRYAGVAGTVEGDAKEFAALHVAEHVITRDGTIRLRVSKGRLSPGALKGLRLLASEGVLRDLGRSWEFFHQTFAEYAHGRWLLGLGVDSDEVANLVARLAGDHTNLWPLARTLLLQAVALDDYQALVAALPSGSPESAKARVLGAVQRAEDGLLPEALAEIRQRPSSMRVVLPTLNDVPLRHRPAVFDAALWALREHPTLLGDVAMSCIVAVMSPSALTWLRATVETLLGLRTTLGHAVHDSYSERVLRPFVDPQVPAEVTAYLRLEYQRFGPLARRACLRAHMVAEPSDEDITALAAVALTLRCPPLPEDELVELVGRFWRSPGVGAARSWSDWRDLLADRLARDWEHGQLMTVVHMALDDRAVTGEVVDDVLTGATRATARHVEALAMIAVRRPDWIADRLAHAALPTDAVALTPVCKCIRRIAVLVDPATRTTLAQWLAPAKDRVPRAVWPTLVVLAADDLTAHRALLDEIKGWAELPVNARGSLVATWVGSTSHAVLTALLNDLRELVADNGAAQYRARLEARVVDTDTAARDWVTARVLTDPSANLVKGIVKTITEDVHDPNPELTSWMYQLLRTRHTYAAEVLAEFLVGLDSAPFATEVVVDRMRNAVAAKEHSKLWRALLRLLIHLDDQQPLPPATVLTVFSLARSRLPADLRTLSDGSTSDHSAALRDMTTLSGTLMARRLPGRQVRDLITEVLRDLDPNHFGRKMAHTMEDLLRSIASRDPDALSWLEEVFGLPKIALAVQLAIAQTFLALDNGRAARLRTRRECPAEVAELIVTRSE
ncbi:SEFIR domain-containing protein [Actinosynnema sp. NPDC091369]